MTNDWKKDELYEEARSRIEAIPHTKLPNIVLFMSCYACAMIYDFTLSPTHPHTAHTTHTRLLASRSPLTLWLIIKRVWMKKFWIRIRARRQSKSLVTPYYFTIYLPLPTWHLIPCLTPWWHLLPPTSSNSDQPSPSSSIQEQKSVECLLKPQGVKVTVEDFSSPIY
jgi:hypothetical protein